MRAGVEVTLVVPRVWAERGMQEVLSDEPFEIVELETARSGDVNRHRYQAADLRAVIERVGPDLIDVHEEPFSVATRQWLAAAAGRPCVAYTAQNVDKRFPPPFAQMERAAYRRLSGIYACSRQAASVARGKGFGGVLDVLPLGRDGQLSSAGVQSIRDSVLVLGLIGRLVPEKGVLDAVRVLAALHASRPSRLVIIGDGPERESARVLADELGVGQLVSFAPWLDAAAMASAYREMHIVLLPSRATETWTEQFGRVIVEGQAAGAVVVGYDSGAIAEVIGDAGVVVPEGDHQAMAAAVEEIVGRHGTWRALRDAGLLAVQELTWDDIARRQAAFYRRALANTEMSSSVGRAAAVSEFGPTARLAKGVDRPFALPVLRRDSSSSRLLARVIDAGSRLRGRSQ